MPQSEFREPKNLSWFLTWIAIGAVSFLLLWGPNGSLPSGIQDHDRQRLAQILVLTIVSAAFILVPTLRDRAAALIHNWGSRVQATILVVLTLGLISSALADHPKWAFLEWCWFVQLAVLGLTMAAGRRSYPNAFDIILLSTVVISCAMYATYCLATYSGMLIGKEVNFYDMFYGFSNPRFAGQFMTLTMPVILSAISLPEKRWSRFLSVLAVVWLTLILLNGTRGTWIGLMVGFGLLMIMNREVCRKLLTGKSSIFIWGAGLYVALAHVLPWLLDAAIVNMFGRSELDDLLESPGRLAAWKLAAAIALDHPLLGIGPMHYAAVWNPVATHPHNILLQLASEWGLPATIMLAWLACSGLLAMGRRLTAAALPHADDLLLAAGLFVAIAASFAQSLVDGVFVMPLSQTTLFVLAGWLAGIQGTSKENARAVKHGTGMTLAVVALSTSIAVVSSTATYWRHPAELETRACLTGARTQPRFWVNGRIGGTCENPKDSKAME